MGDEQYGLHYVTFVGYLIQLNGDNFYIIHDLHTPTSPVYRNWNFDVSTDDDIWYLYLFDPR